MAVTQKFKGLNYLTPLEIISNEPRFINDTQNLRRYSSRTTAQRWELRITFNGGLRDGAFAKLQAHYLKNGLETSFKIAMPQHVGLDEPDSNSTTVDTDFAAGSSSITVASAQGVTAGRFIEIADKVYMVTDVTSNTFSISPNLVAAMTNGDTVIIGTATDENDTTGVRCKVLYENTNQSFTYNSGVLQQIRKQYIEYLE